MANAPPPPPHPRTHTHTRMHTCTHMHTRTHACGTHASTQTHTDTRTHSRMRARPPTHTHAHTRTHAHTPALPCLGLPHFSGRLGPKLLCQASPNLRCPKPPKTLTPQNLEPCPAPPPRLAVRPPGPQVAPLASFGSVWPADAGEPGPHPG